MSPFKAVALVTIVVTFLALGSGCTTTMSVTPFDEDQKFSFAISSIDRTKTDSETTEVSEED